MAAQSRGSRRAVYRAEAGANVLEEIKEALEPTFASILYEEGWKYTSEDIVIEMTLHQNYFRFGMTFAFVSK